MPQKTTIPSHTLTCQLLEADVLGLHLFSLNLEASVSAILRALQSVSAQAGASRRLPWRASGAAGRERESVR